MPVGTVGSVKAVHQRELKEDVEARIILGSTTTCLRPEWTSCKRQADCMLSWAGTDPS